MGDYGVETWLVYECADCRFRWPVQLELDGADWMTREPVDACPRCGSTDIASVPPTDEEAGAI
jgi:hypothetical protein